MLSNFNLYRYSKAPLRRLKGSMKGSYTLVGQTSGKMLEVGLYKLNPVDLYRLNPVELA